MPDVHGWIAEYTAAMVGLVCLSAAWAWSLVWAYRRGRFDRGRANVLAAMEIAVSETVVLPQQRRPGA